MNGTKNKGGAERERRLIWPGKKRQPLNPLPPEEPSYLIHTSEGEDERLCRLYYADNLPVMREFLGDPEVAGKVTLIYLDPPLQGSGFFSKEGSLIKGNDFLSFLHPRLIAAYELLGPQGSLYLQISQEMLFEAKLLLDEIFGPWNFRNLITRQTRSRKNYTKNQFGNVTDYLLFYTKGENYIWNRCYEPWSQEAEEREYPNLEPLTGRRYKTVPLHAPGKRGGETGKVWRGKLPPAGKHWQFTPEKLDALDLAGKLYWSKNGNPRRKIYLDESPGIPANNIWKGFPEFTNQHSKTTGYPAEKDLGLMRRLVQASSNPGDLILDPFCGSGAFLEAAEDLNRVWIGIDENPRAIEITIQRLLSGLRFAEQIKNPQTEPWWIAEDPITKKRLDFSSTVDLFASTETDEQKRGELCSLFNLKPTV